MYIDIRASIFPDKYVVFNCKIYLIVPSHELEAANKPSESIDTESIGAECPSKVAITSYDSVLTTFIVISAEPATKISPLSLFMSMHVISAVNLATNPSLTPSSKSKI